MFKKFFQNKKITVFIAVLFLLLLLPMSFSGLQTAGALTFEELKLLACAIPNPIVQAACLLKIAALENIPEWVSNPISAFLAWLRNTIVSFGVTILAILPEIFIIITLFLASLFYTVVLGLVQWSLTVLTTVDILDAPIVQLGWGFSRDFVNMLFILILAFIGLATILRLETYNIKKTLPLLIVIALLVNFSLIPVGFVVDMGNIITNFFTKAIGDSWGGWTTFIHQTVDYAVFVLSDILKTLSEGGQEPIAAISRVLSTIMQGLVLIGFNMIAGLVLIVIAFLFTVRIIALWLLAILAPFAFAAYILPATKGWWNMWLKQLILWSFVGVPVLFGMYFANYIIKPGNLTVPMDPDKLQNVVISPENDPAFYVSGSGKMMGIQTSATSETNFNWFTDEAAELLTSILGPIMALIIMGAGIMAAFQFAPMFAERSMGAGKSAAMWVATRRPVATRLGKVAGWTEKQMGTVAEKAQELERKVGSVRGGKVWSAAVKPIKWFAQASHGAVGPEMAAWAAKQQRVTLPPGWDMMSDDEKAKYTLNQKELSDKAILASKMKEEGSFQGVAEPLRKKLAEEVKKSAGDPRLKKEVSNVLGDSLGEMTKEVKLKLELSGITDPTEKVKKKEEFERKIKEITAELEETAEASPAIKKAIEGRNREDLAAGMLHARQLTSKDMAALSKYSIDSDEFRLAMRGAHPESYKKLMTSLSPEMSKKFHEGPGGLESIENRKELEKLYARNPRLVHLISTAPGYGDIAKKWETHMPEGYEQFQRETEMRIRGEKELKGVKEAEKEMVMEREAEKRSEEAKIAGRRAGFVRAERTQKEAELEQLEKERMAPKELKGVQKEIKRYEGLKGPVTTGDTEELKRLKGEETRLKEIIRHAQLEKEKGKIEEEMSRLKKMAIRDINQENRLRKLRQDLKDLGMAKEVEKRLGEAEIAREKQPPKTLSAEDVLKAIEEKKKSK